MGGSERGYHQLVVSLASWLPLFTPARRVVGQVVCLCIAAFGVNVR